MTLADIIRNARPVMNQLTSWDVPLVNDKNEVINDIQFELIRNGDDIKARMTVL